VGSHIDAGSKKDGKGVKTGGARPSVSWGPMGARRWTTTKKEIAFDQEEGGATNLHPLYAVGEGGLLYSLEKEGRGFMPRRVYLGEEGRERSFSLGGRSYGGYDISRISRD